jgi:NADPH-dependent glutamate synthase beta subunit-like oxidoreductase
MSITPIIIAVAMMFGLGIVCSLLLAVASKVFFVEEDPRIAMVEEALMGANCGGCGFAGCNAAAEAVVAGKAGANVCVAGGPAIAARVGAAIGQAVDLDAEPKVAVLNCRGSYRVNERFDYQGIQDCRAAALYWDGAKECGMSCLGLGTCKSVCPFGAIEMGPDHMPVINTNLCVGCGTCVKNCPHHVLHLETLSERLLAFNRTDECVPPCRQLCPAQIDIPRYIRYIKNGMPLAAVETIKERNCMPLSIGRVCPHPCEDACRRRFVDEAVNINHLKRYAADIEMYQGPTLNIRVARNTGKRVAVIGGGPAGLSTAFFLRRLGHSPEIFEMMPKLGGMTRYGIPEYRLPKKILDWECQQVVNLGVPVHYGKKLGEDMTIQSLREDDGFEAIMLGIGCWTSSAMRCDGEDLPGVFGGITFLIGQGLNKPLPLGKKVVVIGGGNTAIDCARTSLRRGADVTLLYRRTRKEMPANMIEIVEAEREGVKFHFLAAPTKIYANKDGNAAQLEYIRMELGEPDASGRRRPVPIEGSNTIMEVDNILSAIGQRADLSFAAKEAEEYRVETTKWSTFAANEQTLQTNIPFVFTSGDVFTGPQTVVKALGTGRRAARAIHLFVTGQEVTAPPSELLKPTPEALIPHITGVAEEPRAHMPELTIAERSLNFKEVELGLKPGQADRESQRCLQCGNVCFDQSAFDELFVEA